MDTDAAVRAWIDAWVRGWPAADAELVASAYADDAVLRSLPFREQQSPREYVEWAFAEQDAAECWFGKPIVDGDRATVEYWGVVSSGGREETFAGVSVLRFGQDGKVVEHRDYWAAQAGRHEPPDGWGS